MGGERMSIKDNERALKVLEEEIGKSRNKIYQLERADVTDRVALKELPGERQCLEALEKKRVAVQNKLDEERDEAKKLTAKFEALAASLRAKYESLATSFIDKLADYLEGDLREEFIEIYTELEALHSEADRAYTQRERVEGGTDYGSHLLPGANQFTFNTRVAKLLDTWEYKTRNEMIRRSKEAREAMKK